ncbi:MAG: chromosomal replication initiator protein [Thermoleophilaceae bacterium]|nr:chromosomal replication initiator protein [Thermoleophilaceae bacterium]MEA2407241.1 chromosomal replication initiator protein [Thermoleophilaceae bacterium]
MPTPPDEIWDAIRGELRKETPDFQFHIWLDPLELAAIRGTTVYVRAPEHIRTSVAERYLPLLRRAAAAGFDQHALVEVVGADWEPPADDRAPDAAQGDANGFGAVGADRPRQRLNPRYTFEQFVIGEGNRFAHAASLAVAELPAHSYNPLFLHGSPGIGKTHLLHAIGNYVDRFGSGLQVRYATIEEFTSEFVEAVRKNSTADFKQRFRGSDVVLIDDVQFLAGRDRTREEFFHTFNSLLDGGRQLVMTSDRAPEDIPGLEARLIERFQSGLVVELETPELPVRMAILAKRARVDNVEVGADVLEEIARRVTTSVRALEGALIRVVAYASMRDEPPTPALARHVLRRLGEDTAPDSCGLVEILDAAAQEFGVDRDALLARDRRPTVAAARQVAMYLARELTEHSLPEIGRGIGGRNHTTVLHAVNRIGAALRTDEDVRTAVDNLRRRLGHPSS